MSKLSVTIGGEGMRSQISVPTPNSSLYSILSEFCKKNNEDPANYQLKYRKNVVDLQLPFRLSGIPNNASLEIERVKGGKKKTAGVATIGLQLPDNKRIVAQFNTNMVLWEVLLQTEKQNNINITKTGVVEKKTKKVLYQIPTINYMNQAIKSIEDLQKRTLAELGLRSGDNAMLRVVYEQTDKTVEEMEPILSSYVPQQESTPSTPKPKPSVTTPSTVSPSEDAPVVIQNAVQKQDDDDAPAEDKMDIDTPAVQEETKKVDKSHLFLPIQDDSAVHIKLYKMVNPQFDPKELELEESEFELTPEELKEFIANSEKKKEEREALKTEKIRLIEKQTKQKKYPKALIRFRFPSGLIVQAAYNPTHKVAKLYQLIPKLLENPQTPFYLYIAPPVQRLDDAKEKKLEEANLVPASIVNVALDKKVAKPDDKDPTIHSNFLTYVQEIEKEQIPKAVSTSDTEQQSQQQTAENKGTGKKLGSAPTEGKDKKKGVPKWFKPL